MTAQGLPQRGERVDGQHRAETARRIPQCQAECRRRRGLDVTVFEGLPGCRRLAAHRVIAAGFGGTGKVADGIAAARWIGPEIDAAAVAPGVPRQPVGGDKGQMVLQPLAEVGKQRVEDPSRREHRRPGVDCLPVAGDGAQLAARHRLPLENRHRHAVTGQTRSGAQPADARPDNHHWTLCRQDRLHCCR